MILYIRCSYIILITNLKVTETCHCPYTMQMGLSVNAQAIYCFENFFTEQKHSCLGFCPDCGFLVFWLTSPLSVSLCFITVFLIICVSLWCFTDEVEDPYADRTYIFNLNPRFKDEIEHGCSPQARHPTPHRSVVFLPIVPRRSLRWSSRVFVRVWLHM